MAAESNGHRWLSSQQWTAILQAVLSVAVGLIILIGGSYVQRLAEQIFSNSAQIREVQRVQDQSAPVLAQIGALVQQLSGQTVALDGRVTRVEERMIAMQDRLVGLNETQVRLLGKIEGWVSRWPTGPQVLP